MRCLPSWMIISQATGALTNSVTASSNHRDEDPEQSTEKKYRAGNAIVDVCNRMHSQGLGDDKILHTSDGQAPLDKSK